MHLSSHGSDLVCSYILLNDSSPVECINVGDAEWKAEKRYRVTQLDEDRAHEDQVNL